MSLFFPAHAAGATALMFFFYSTFWYKLLNEERFTLKADTDEGQEGGRMRRVERAKRGWRRMDEILGEETARQRVRRVGRDKRRTKRSNRKGNQKSLTTTFHLRKFTGSAHNHNISFFLFISPSSSVVMFCKAFATCSLASFFPNI